MTVIRRKKTWEQYEQEVEEYNERTRQAIAAFHKNEKPRRHNLLGWGILLLIVAGILLTAMAGLP